MGFQCQPLWVVFIPTSASERGCGDSEKVACEYGLFLDLGATALMHKTGCTEAQLKRAELGLHCRAEHKEPRSPSRW
jgi:hypothetical protein